MAKHWIAGAIKRPGALHRRAARTGGLTKKGKIKASWLAKWVKKKGRAGKQARLARTMKSFRKKRKIMIRQGLM